MNNSRYVSVIEGEEVRGDDPIKCFLLIGVGSTFGVLERVMAIEVSENKENSGGGNTGEKESILLFFEERIGVCYPSEKSE